MDQSEIQTTAEITPKRTNDPERPVLTNPNLGASLSADYEALRNDVDQANELAAEFQRRLSEKSNEVAIFKQVFEKTRSDLAAMHANVTELRQERHRLANEAMRATAFEMKLNRAVTERDQLRAELETARGSLDAACKEISQRTQNPDALVARLTRRVESLEAQLAAARRAPNAGPTCESLDLELKATVSTISAAVERLKEIIGPVAAVQPKPARHSPPKEAVEEHIEISFSA